MQLRADTTGMLFAMSYGGMRCRTCGVSTHLTSKNSSEFRCLHKGYSPGINGKLTIVYVCSTCKDMLISINQFTPLSK